MITWDKKRVMLCVKWGATQSEWMKIKVNDIRTMSGLMGSVSVSPQLNGFGKCNGSTGGSCVKGLQSTGKFFCGLQEEGGIRKEITDRKLFWSVDSERNERKTDHWEGKQSKVCGLKHQTANSHIVTTSAHKQPITLTHRHSSIRLLFLLDFHYVFPFKLIYWKSPKVEWKRSFVCWVHRVG